MLVYYTNNQIFKYYGQTIPALRPWCQHVLKGQIMPGERNEDEGQGFLNPKLSKGEKRFKLIGGFFIWSERNLFCNQ